MCEGAEDSLIFCSLSRCISFIVVKLCGEKSKHNRVFVFCVVSVDPSEKGAAKWSAASLLFLKGVFVQGMLPAEEMKHLSEPSSYSGRSVFPVTHIWPSDTSLYVNHVCQSCHEIWAMRHAPCSVFDFPGQDVKTLRFFMMNVRLRRHGRKAAAAQIPHLG